MADDLAARLEAKANSWPIETSTISLLRESAVFVRAAQPVLDAARKIPDHSYSWWLMQLDLLDERLGFTQPSTEAQTDVRALLAAVRASREAVQAPTPTPPSADEYAQGVVAHVAAAPTPTPPADTETKP